MTYSVAAVDQDEGVMGVAVQSHWLAVGAIVPWAAAGTGALATQANSDLTAGRRGLELLASSRSAAATLAACCAMTRAPPSARSPSSTPPARSRRTPGTAVWRRPGIAPGPAGRSRPT